MNQCTSNEHVLTMHVLDKEDSTSEGHKLVMQQQVQFEGDNESNQEFKDITAHSEEGCESRATSH